MSSQLKLCAPFLIMHVWDVLEYTDIGSAKVEALGEMQDSWVLTSVLTSAFVNDEGLAPYLWQLTWTVMAIFRMASNCCADDRRLNSALLQPLIQIVRKQWEKRWKAHRRADIAWELSSDSILHFLDPLISYLSPGWGGKFKLKFS